MREKKENFKKMEEKYARLPAKLHQIQDIFGPAEKEIIYPRSVHEIAIFSGRWGEKPKEIRILDEDKELTGVVLAEFARKVLKPQFLKILVAVFEDYDEQTADYRHPERVVIADVKKILERAKFKKDRWNYKREDKELVACFFETIGRLKASWVERKWKWKEDRVTKSGRHIQKGGYKSPIHEEVAITPLFIIHKAAKKMNLPEVFDSSSLRKIWEDPDKIKYQLGEIWWHLLYGDEKRSRIISPLNTEIFYSWHGLHQRHELLLHLYYSQMHRVNWKKYKGKIRQRLKTILTKTGIPLGIEDRNYMRTYDNIKKVHHNLAERGAIKDWKVEELIKSGINVFENRFEIYPPDGIYNLLAQSEVLNREKPDKI